jgi:hypothetical protein
MNERLVNTCDVLSFRTLATLTWFIALCHKVIGQTSLVSDYAQLGQYFKQISFVD